MTTATLLSPETEQFRADVMKGLTGKSKQLPPKYFYDATGSQLFDQITELREYYPTRTELQIMRTHAREMAARCGSRCLLIELGAGSLVKVRLLLDHMDRPAGFIPVDVSGEHLQQAAAELAADYPKLNITPIAADFTRKFEIPHRSASRRVVYFPGSTIGNFDPDEADELLGNIAELVGPDGGLLLGADLRKSPAVLEAAYNDARGVTAAFNLNLLARINRELDADFDQDSFRHRAFYNRERSRIEMHLLSLVPQRVRIGDSVVTFRAGESIHTENSYKYEITDLSQRALNAGLRLDAVWTDPRRYFAVCYFTAISIREGGC